ncbi:MAG: hypothetical protein ABI239_09455 [Aquihabitans sp.]
MDLDDRANRASRGLHLQVGADLDLTAAQDAHQAATRLRRSKVVKMRVGLAAGTALAVLAVAAFVAGDKGNDAGFERADGTVDVGVDTNGMSAEDRASGAKILAAMPSSPIDGKESWRLPVQVRPQSGLVDGQTVTVYGKGFGPHESLGIVQCTAEADVDNLGVVGCELGPEDDVYSGVTYASADPAGNVIAQVVVKRYINTVSGEVDCFETAERCLIGMGAISNYDQSGGAYLNFADAPDFDTPTLSVDPAGPLAAGQDVNVAVTGWVPKRPVRIQQCVGDICQDLLDGKADEGGSFNGTVIVGNAVIDPESGATVPCDGTCVLKANGIGVEGASSQPFPDPVPLDFGLDPITEGPSEMAVTTTVPPTTEPVIYPEDPEMTPQSAPEPLLPPGVRPGDGTTEMTTNDTWPIEGEAVPD